MTLRCEYRYVSTEARAEYLKANAPERVYNAYMKLTDGAAQADLWRLAVIHEEGGLDVEFRDRKLVCIQGTFTNEYFQYLDRPRGKWIHSQPEGLIKK